MSLADLKSVDSSLSTVLYIFCCFSMLFIDYRCGSQVFIFMGGKINGNKAEVLKLNRGVPMNSIREFSTMVSSTFTKFRENRWMRSKASSWFVSRSDEST